MTTLGRTLHPGRKYPQGYGRGLPRGDNEWGVQGGVQGDTEGGEQWGVQGGVQWDGPCHGVDSSVLSLHGALGVRRRRDSNPRGKLALAGRGLSSVPIPFWSRLQK